MTWGVPGETVYSANQIFPPGMAAHLDRLNEQYREAQEEWRKQQEQAEAKARKLFLSKLTEVQKKTLEKDNEIFVRGSKGNWYRINCQYTAENVWSVPLDGREEVWSYCAGPPGVPESDVWLAQKLLIEADEDAFLAVAIRS